MTLNVESVAADLASEHAALDTVLTPLSDEQWCSATPAEGWSVADTVAHLTYFDRTAATAVTDPDEFQRSFEELLACAEGGVDALDDLTIGWSREMSSAELLAEWRKWRANLLSAAATLGPDDRVPWYGPSMGAKSFLTARLMETWAHGQDVVDAVGATRVHTDRLKHIAQLGYITRKWAYINRGEETPEGEIHLELTAPSGEIWSWGEQSAENRISGRAADFALVVCQRRNVADTELVVIGNVAGDWMAKAQVFAGPPTQGRAPAGGLR